MIFQLTPDQMIFLNHLMMYLSTIGFGFALANALIGISHIKNLKELSISEIKAHKGFGRTGGLIFYLLSILCIYFAVIPKLNPSGLEDFIKPTIFWHTFIGGIVAFIFLTIKLSIAKFKKDLIYKYGKFIGPLGFSGWFLAYFTSNIDFYFYVIPNISFMSNPYLMPNFFVSLIFSLFMGIVLFIVVKAIKYKEYGGKSKAQSLHGVAMILHGITFGYEGSAKDLIGTPVLYKYVFPKTYQFLERYAGQIGLDLEELKKHNLNDALEIAMNKFASIGMAEKLKIRWLSDNELTIESINCSTAVVRSYMNSDELIGSICPWAILSATIINTLIDKELEISPSEFNQIGALTKLKIIDKKNI
ncbi:MAG: hypothetical protein JXA99_06375 [Candidatus Lokiarchaeota archaeon]|nr:hypothetical protein [Candidatus Lokiarchaeota archaeon]